METHEQPTQYFEPQFRTEPATHLPAKGETPDQIYFPAPRGRKMSKRPFIPTIIKGMVLIAIVAFGALSALGAGWFIQSDIIAPGVTVMGIDIGQHSKAEAMTRLTSSWQAQTVILVNGDESWTVSPAELGVTFDAKTTVELAHQQGRNWQSWQRFWQYQGQFPVQPVWQLDPTVTRAYLEQQAAALNVEPVNAQVAIVNGRVEIIPATEGRQVDVEATLASFTQQAATVVINGRLPLITQSTPAAITDVSATAEQAEQLLSTTVTINAYDPINDFDVSWVVSPVIWGEWFVLDIDPADQSQFNWTLDHEKGESYFAERMAALGDGRYVEVQDSLTAVSQAIQNKQETVTLRIFHQPSTYQVQSGDTLASIGRKVGIPYPWLQQANPNIGSLSAGQLINVPSPDVMLPLPIVDNKRIVVSISEQRVWVYENGQLKWDWLASTGISSSPTAPGIFQIQTHVENAYAGNWNLYMPDFMGVYQPAPNVDFMNGFHGFPTRDGVNLLWTQNLGAPVTYGCILLSNEHIAQLYAWADDGVVVEIRP